MFCVRAELVSLFARSAEGLAPVGRCCAASECWVSTRSRSSLSLPKFVFYPNQRQGAAFLSNFPSPKGESDLKLIVLFWSKYFNSAFPVN